MVLFEKRFIYYVTVINGFCLVLYTHEEQIDYQRFSVRYVYLFFFAVLVYLWFLYVFTLFYFFFIFYFSFLTLYKLYRIVCMWQAVVMTSMLIVLAEGQSGSSSDELGY